VLKCPGKAKGWGTKGGETPGHWGDGGAAETGKGCKRRQSVQREKKTVRVLGRLKNVKPHEEVGRELVKGVAVSWRIGRGFSRHVEK